MAFARLDHVIARVPDIRASHARLIEEHGFAEAWPIGAFWPAALTSGVALGGLNLELVQSLEGAVGPNADTLVFEPKTLEAASDALTGAGVAVRRFEKVEPNPELLRLRGFEGSRPERICTNLMPESPAPLDFFVCEYAPFLRERLAPHRFPMQHGEARSVEVVVPDPEAAEAFLAKVGYAGVPLRFAGGESHRVRTIAFADGRVLALDRTTL